MGEASVAQVGGEWDLMGEALVAQVWGGAHCWFFCSHHQMVDEMRVAQFWGVQGLLEGWRRQWVSGYGGQEKVSDWKDAHPSLTDHYDR